MLFASFLSAFLSAAACSAAYADQPVAGPALPPAHIALDIAPAKIRAPYDVQIFRENGEALPTYSLKDRFYVQGNAGERYIIRITNPTDRRIEAVVSVDGLDVIDGENGDLRKRGYVVPAWGETRIEGFRTSQADVATFRFSSVSGSYAGQKGKARNVGVIAVALFEEQAAEPEQQIIVGQAAPPPPPHRMPYDFRGDLDGRRSADSSASAPAPAPAGRGVAKADAAKDAAGNAGSRMRSTPRHTEKRVAEAPAARPVPMPPSGGPGSEAGRPGSMTRGGAGRYAPPSDNDADDEEAPMPQPELRPSHERLGLGTEFGEQRYSAASYTRFVRAPGRPIAIAELRYNDAAGLMALGIAVQPLPDAGEIMTRETANPFPGDRFARAPR
jgi:hypothetical protein